MELSAQERRQAFAWWLRTGRLPAPRGDDGRELKFNPYHDPHDGRFTFASGAGGSSARLAAAEGGPGVARGSNIRAFEDPMTLEQAFPGLRTAPGGAIVAVADEFLNITGPANEVQAEVSRNRSRELMAQIKAIEPRWHYDELGPITTVEGLSSRYDDLRFQYAAVAARAKGDYRPLQAETVRFIQQRADAAYQDGTNLLRNAKLKPRLSDQEALGNYVDRVVRKDLRDRYNSLNIDSAGAGPVRVNRRENDSSGSDVTYRRPDARVGDVAFDVTLSRKTLATPQVRGFFSADFRPNIVVIVRPRSLGAGHTYIIRRPEAKK